MRAGLIEERDPALTSQMIWAGTHGWVSLELCGIGFVARIRRPGPSCMSRGRAGGLAVPAHLPDRAAATIHQLGIGRG